MLSRPAAGIFLTPGLGKTTVALAAYDKLLKGGAIRGMLVIAPLQVCEHVWTKDDPASDLARWDNFKHLTVSFMHGKKKIEALRARSDIHVINPEGVPWLVDQRPDFRDYMLVVDESTLFKHTRTKRFKALRSILPQFARRYVLTGTPNPNGLMDLFGQIYIVDLGAALGKYISHYRSEFFSPTGYGGYTWVPQPDAGDRIMKKLRPITIVETSEDILKLPACIETDVRVTLPLSARGVYKALEKDFIVALENGLVTAKNAGVASMKLRQVVNGAVYVDEELDGLVAAPRMRDGERPWSEVHAVKIEALSNLLDQLGDKQVLIAYEFRHDLQRLRNLLGKDVFVLGENRDAIEAWNDGRARRLLVHPARAARGLNLQHGGYAIVFFSLTWNWEHYYQLVKRLHRRGRREPVFVYRIIASGTVDELRVLAAIRRKELDWRELLIALGGRS